MPPVFGPPQTALSTAAAAPTTTSTTAGGVNHCLPGEACFLPANPPVAPNATTPCNGTQPSCLYSTPGSPNRVTTGSGEPTRPVVVVPAPTSTTAGGYSPAYQLSFTGGNELLLGVGGAAVLLVGAALARRSRR